MAVYEVFSQAELRRYKTHICSKASIFQLLCTVLTFVPPLLVAFRSQGFWLKFDDYREQADVTFKHQFLVILQLQDASYITYSTFQKYNNLQMENLRLPLIKSHEADDNRDGKLDALHLTLEMPLLDMEQVIGCQLLLFFDYKLWKFSTFQMESLAYIQYSSVLAGASLHTVGDLALQQKEPIYHKGIDDRFNASIIDTTSVYAEAYDLATIFESYSARNVTTVFSNVYPVWTTGRSSSSPFTIKATVRYPEETILYTPGFWQLLKWAWIQYVTILIVFIFLFHRVRVFVFQNQLVSTIVQRPWSGQKMT